MTYAKIVDNKLNTTEDTKVVFTSQGPTRVPKTPEELAGYKPLQYDTTPTTTVYEHLVETYIETDTEITVRQVVTKNSVEDIAAYNASFWAANYVLIPTFMPDVRYAARWSTKDGHTLYLEGETFSLMLDGIAMAEATGQPFVLEMYAEPDYTQEFTSEYISTLKTLYSSTEQTALVEACMGYIGTLVYTGRDVPSVL